MAWRQVTNSSDGNDFTYWQDDKTGEMAWTDPTPGVDDSAAYDDARFLQVWNSTPGDVQAKLNATAELTGAGIAQIAPWAQKNGLATNADLQANIGIQQLAARGYSLRGDGQIQDPMQSDWDVALGLAPVVLGAAGFAGAAAAGVGAAGSATGAGVGAADAAGALGGAAGTAGGGLTAAEAAGLTGAAGTAAGTTGGMIGTEAALSAGGGATGTVGAAGGVAAGGGLGGATTGGTALAGGSALSRVLGGAGSNTDWASLLGTLGATGLGVYGSGQQADAYRDIANQSRADRAPYLARSLEYLNNPQAYINGPGQASMDATLRSLSASGGNPIDQPTSLAIATQAGLRDWQNAVTGFGNLGLAGEDTRANLMAQGANADANQFNALGYGLGELTRPRRQSLGDYLASLS
jgi:hypothetical protein